MEAEVPGLGGSWPAFKAAKPDQHITMATGGMGNPSAERHGDVLVGNMLEAVTLQRRQPQPPESGIKREGVGCSAENIGCCAVGALGHYCGNNHSQCYCIADAATGSAFLSGAAR